MLLDDAVRRLGRAGEPEAAARIAAKAWWVVRGNAPVCARRLNATLHYLTLGAPARERKENR